MQLSGHLVRYTNCRHRGGDAVATFGGNMDSSKCSLRTSPERSVCHLPHTEQPPLALWHPPGPASASIPTLPAGPLQPDMRMCHTVAWCFSASNTCCAVASARISFSIHTHSPGWPSAARQADVSHSGLVFCCIKACCAVAFARTSFNLQTQPPGWPSRARQAAVSCSSQCSHCSRDLKRQMPQQPAGMHVGLRPHARVFGCCMPKQPRHGSCRHMT